MSIASVYICQSKHTEAVTDTVTSEWRLVLVSDIRDTANRALTVADRAD